MLSQTLRRAGKTQESDTEATIAERLSRKEKQAPLIASLDGQGLRLIDEGHGQEGLAKIKQALDLDPGNSSTQLDYALALRRCRMSQ